ncbi:unnamed protein product [Cuscuta europaea]|uniref:Uncharacterized protein n=1 Tax=Cuscuta europaea TaxID=41803 RepID=A0A9P0VNH2_CUSEU|nr:unnamed protein product [Cuscuta europaea]
MVLKLPPHRRLAPHPPPSRRRILHAAHIRGHGCKALLHDPKDFRRHFRRRSHQRPRELPLRLRRGEAPDFDLRPPHRHPARVHRLLRIPPREAEVHTLLGQRHRVVDHGRRSSCLRGE